MPGPGAEMPGYLSGSGTQMSRGIVTPSTTHPAPLGWNNPPTPPRWNASESPIIARRCPHDISSKGKTTPAAETALNRLSENPGTFQQVESETIPLQAIPTTPPIPQKVPQKVSLAKRSETRRSKTGSGEAPSALRKNPSIPRSLAGNLDSP